MKPIYIGDIDLTYDTLEHYGVKGMKWGKRKKKPDHSKNRWKRKREKEQSLKDAYNKARTYEERAAIRTALSNSSARDAFGNQRGMGAGIDYRKRNNPYTIDNAQLRKTSTVQRETIAKDKHSGNDMFEWQVYDYSKKKKKKSSK